VNNVAVRLDHVATPLILNSVLIALVKPMNTKLRIAGVIAAIGLVLAIGYFFAVYRHGRQIAEYDKREQERMQKIAANDAEQNKLRGENQTLREQNAQLSAQNEAQEAIIKERGGSIAREQEKLQQIDERLKQDEAVINAPADKCVRCRRFSAAALEQRIIDKPLSCKDECGNQ
jgi:uncharacterized protein HemX